LGRDVKGYIGQELYLNGKPETLRGFGYQDFYLDHNEASKETFNAANVYNCCSPKSKYNAKYDEIAGKYFKVLDVIRHPRLFGYYLKLQEKTTGKTLYFRYSDDKEVVFPFIVVGFFEKLKQHVGQTYVFGKIKPPIEVDIKTGKQVDLEVGKEWKCTNVTINEKTYRLSMVFENNEGQVIMMQYDSIIGNKKHNNIFNKIDADKYATKFGKDIWNTILQGSVKIGMTNEACILSWGIPSKINETITAGNKTEQWVYPNNYLYFTDGILTAIQ
jgi:hypothetical protein